MVLDLSEIKPIHARWIVACMDPLLKGNKNVDCGWCLSELLSG